MLQLLKVGFDGKFNACQSSAKKDLQKFQEMAEVLLLRGVLTCSHMGFCHFLGFLQILLCLVISEIR